MTLEPIWRGARFRGELAIFVLALLAWGLWRAVRALWNWSG